MFHVEQKLETLTNCPICGSSSYRTHLIAKDHTVSKQTFDITGCNGCEFLYTNPRPDANSLGAYYESEEYISHSNTNKGLINSLYQSIRNITLKQKLGLINSNCKKGSILDIGSGTGEFLNTCKKNGWNTFGIEPSDIGRSSCINKYGLDVRPESELAVFNNQTFDAITLWHVLEHVPNLQERVQEIKRILKKDGTLIIAVPNPSSHDASKYKEFWAAYDVPRHLYHFKPLDIKNLFSKHGFKIEKIKPMVFDSFYVSMLSEKYKSGGSGFVRGVITGIISNTMALFNKNTFSSQIYILKQNERK